jgi:A/G-specific adenine glycosylase
MKSTRKMKKIIEEKDALFIKSVLDFYKKYGRHDLMWRKKQNAYKVLVSEIMLQQTQVKRVEEKFKVWVEIYPTLQSLKKASLQDILILWQGLGYQRRAKALYQIAKKYIRIPKTFLELCDMPSVGSYTASAVCAFAYNQFSHPMLETNIRTALIEEYHQGEQEIHDGVLYDDLSRLVMNGNIQKVGARVWYYALMDYGAHLKENKISHNIKSKHYVKQSIYKGSLRELRAKVLFAITHQEKLPKDERLLKVLEALIKEGYIIKLGRQYRIKD